MADQIDASMSDAGHKNTHSELAADASSLVDVTVSEERASKRLKMDDSVPGENLHDAPAGKDNESSLEVRDGQKPEHTDGRSGGIAQIKKEFLIEKPANNENSGNLDDDDAAESRGHSGQEAQQGGANGSQNKKDKKKKAKGQNTERSFGSFDDAIRLCNSRSFFNEFSPSECKFEGRCRLEHDLRKYFDVGRRGDVETLGGKCPVYEQYGKCPSGWKCRFVKSHMKEVEREDGRKELVLLGSPAQDDDGVDGAKGEQHDGANLADYEARPGVYNVVGVDKKIALSKKKVDLAKAETYIQWLNKESKLSEAIQNRGKDESGEKLEEIRARFVDPPLKPSEKRRLYFGPETPALAPLTTQGNLPFRRLCVELGAQLTYSEMAIGMPLVQGTKADWTLLKAHESELSPPKIKPNAVPLVSDYDNSRDLKFGAQISGSNYMTVVKAADVLNRYCPHLRLIDLNCGCPIDMVYKSGGGSALLENQGKLERMIRGMNVMSGEVPITAKIRMGVRSSRPTAPQIIERLAFGTREHRERLGAPGCAAVTLHGRSREQRYTKRADWGYIGECAALIKSYNEEKDALTDTAAEPDASTLPNARDGRMYFLGNGDCYSHVDYYDHIDKARVDSVMVGRGALIKPWLFEEIEKGQYLDKSSSERLTYIEKFVRYGLDAWGSDELGLGFTRRFLLEWLSFAHRYVPIGLLEHLPPSLNERPPAYRGRDDMETLMASKDYRDWIKISEMFLGPVHPTFKFQPKHKSNAYEAEG